MGLLVPGETAVVVGGVVAAEGDVELVPLIGLVWLAAAAGDLVSFAARSSPRAAASSSATARACASARSGSPRSSASTRATAASAVLLGRFVGLVRAVSPFLAGASGLALRRFLPWSLAGALLWAATFTLVGYGFSESFAESGETAARIALGAALVAALGYAAVTVLRARSGRGRPRQGHGTSRQRSEAAERPERRADERPGDDVEREVHAQVHARERHGRGDHERRQDEGAGTGWRGRLRRRRPWRCDPRETRDCPGSRSASRVPGRPPAGERGRRRPSGRA